MVDRTNPQASEPAPGKTRRSQTTMRRYTATDIPRIVELCSAAVPQLPNYAGWEVDAARLTQVLTHNVKMDGAFLCLVLCDSHGTIQGGVAAFCLPTMFSFDMFAYDVFFWIEPRWRSLRSANMLIEGYVKWATARRARIIQGSFTSGYKTRGMDQLLLRAGFHPIGTIYHHQNAAV